MRSAIVAALFLAWFLALPALAAEDKPAVREIPTKGLKLKFPEGGKATAPATITSAEELKKSPVVGDAAAELMKQVDFTKEKLVVFAWGGSGQDRIAGALKGEGKGASAVFTYTRGLTRDFRMHFHLYAVPKDAKVEVVPAK